MLLNEKATKGRKSTSVVPDTQKSDFIVDAFETEEKTSDQLNNEKRPIVNNLGALNPC